MSRKTTVILPDDLHAAWKTAGLPLAEIIRRGLRYGTPAVSNPQSAEQRADQLAGTIAFTRLSDRLDQLTERVTTLEQHQADDTEPWDPEAMADRAEEYQRRRAEVARRRVLDHAGPERPVIVDSATAAVALKMTQEWARHWLYIMEGAGFASRANGKPPYKWRIHDPEEATDAVPVA